MADSLLIDQSPDSNGRYFVLAVEPVVLGRAPFADLGFESRLVSRRHARITCEDGSYLIRDLESANGTAVNGAPVSGEPTALQPGDLISLAGGAVELLFESEGKTVRIGAGRSPDESRDRPELHNQANLVDLPDLEVDSLSRIVAIDGRIVDPPLSRKEFDVLELLYQASGQACSLDEISAAGWPERPEAAVDSREVSQLIRRIRRRVGLPTGSVQIDNVRGYGYRLSGL